jgi:hypothetical protein
MTAQNTSRRRGLRAVPESIAVTVFVPIIVGNARRAVLFPWPG